MKQKRVRNLSLKTLDLEKGLAFPKFSDGFYIPHDLVIKKFTQKVASNAFFTSSSSPDLRIKSLSISTSLNS